MSKYWDATESLPIDEWLDKQVGEALVDYAKHSKIYLYDNGLIEWTVEDGYDANFAGVRKYVKLPDLVDAFIKFEIEHREFDDDNHETLEQYKKLQRIFLESAEKIGQLIKRSTE